MIMKKILNSSFLGVCFLAAILAEAYIIRVDTGNLFSVVGIGIVALIMGYLLLDSIKSGLDQRINDAKLYFDQIYREETEKGNERFTEESNLQKATYTALKKNGVQLSQHTEEMMERLEALEHNMTKALTTLTELQKKAMEGQRNALNYEVNYNKENTKRLIQALKAENNSAEIMELLMKLLTGMERNNELMEKQLNSFNHISFETASAETDQKKEPVVSEEILSEETVSEDVISEKEDVFTYDVESLSEEPQMGDSDSWEDLSLELNGLIGKEDTEENAPEAEAAIAAEPEAEAVQMTDEMIDSPEEQVSESDNQTITPLYSDPNKALTADEIAALFASFGQ